jgi:hypothetical protein
MVEKRLNWNLEGVGPNNGLIVHLGTPGFELYPLLPVAVKNSDYDMVKLLVKHGADLNPKDWNEYLSTYSGRYYKNTIQHSWKTTENSWVIFWRKAPAWNLPWVWQSG